MGLKPNCGGSSRIKAGADPNKITTCKNKSGGTGPVGGSPRARHREDPRSPGNQPCVRAVVSRLGWRVPREWEASRRGILEKAGAGKVPCICLGPAWGRRSAGFCPPVDKLVESAVSSKS